MARLSEIGKAAGLDMSKYQPCLDQGTHDATIAADDARVSKTIAGTPTLYVNDAQVGDTGYIPTLAQIKAAVDVALSATPSPSS
jgi:protein-disulfide isomerase